MQPLSRRWAPPLVLLALLSTTFTLVGCPGFGDQANVGTLTEVPDEPTYEQHIKPIMALYCDSCHSGSPSNGAPGGFRTDLCADGDKPGLKSVASRSLARMRSDGRPMPPSSYTQVTDIENDTMALWVSRGAACEGTGEANSIAPNSIAPNNIEPYHPEGWVEPEVHGLAAKLQTEDCRPCHGDDLRGGTSAVSCDTCHMAGWRTKCTRCHGGMDNDTGAPPDDLNPDEPGVFQGHAAHVTDQNHEAWDCDTCHKMPKDVLSAGHMFDDTPARAEVDMSQGRLSPEGTYDPATSTCADVYCHGNGRTKGTIEASAEPRECDGCHGNVGNTTGLSGEHRKHLREGVDCWECHGSVVDASNDIVDPLLHVDGLKEILFDNPNVTRAQGACSGTCHGERHRSERW